MSGSELAHVDGPPLARPDEMIWLGEIPAIGAARCADRAAIIFADRGVTTSYAQLEAYSNAFAALLQGRGLAQGDRIAYLGRNNDTYFAVLLGAIRAGVVLVPLNWRLAPAEISYQLADSGLTTPPSTDEEHQLDPTEEQEDTDALITVQSPQRATPHTLRRYRSQRTGADRCGPQHRPAVEGLGEPQGGSRQKASPDR